jgi:hypothetical protein
LTSVQIGFGASLPQRTDKDTPQGKTFAGTFACRTEIGIAF